MVMPELESVRGSVVTRNMFHKYYTELAEPMTLTINGQVKGFIGGGTENKIMRRALTRAGKRRSRLYRPLYLRLSFGPARYRPMLYPKSRSWFEG